jgi:hypothetical protein
VSEISRESASKVFCLSDFNPVPKILIGNPISNCVCQKFILFINYGKVREKMHKKESKNSYIKKTDHAVQFYLNWISAHVSKIFSIV